MLLHTVVVVLALAAPAGSKPAATGSRWKVEREKSPVDDSEKVTLSVRALSPIRAWPATVSTPTLLVRCQEGHLETFVATGARPKTDYGHLDSSTATVRFDKDAASDVRMNQSTSGTALFFPDGKEAAEAIQDHRSMFFRFTPFNSNPQDTRFDLAGFEAAAKPLYKACNWDPLERWVSIRLQLLSQLKDTSSEGLRASSAKALATLDRRVAGPAIEGLIAALSDQSAEVRAAAAGSLAALKAETAVPQLRLLTTDEDAGVVEAATRAVAELTAKKAR